MNQYQNHGSDVATELPVNEESNVVRVGLSIAVIVLCAAIIFTFFAIRRKDRLASQAVNLGTTFIESSPVVEENLGTVQSVKEVREGRPSDRPQVWNVAFDVSGTQRSGEVQMRLQNADGQWNVLSAKLEEGRNRPVNLR
jgi:cytochrome oxidase complex assembly protein 1